MWEAKNIDAAQLNGGQQIGNATPVTSELFNNIVSLLLYLEEV